MRVGEVVRMHQGSIFLRPHSQVLYPLVEPDAFECPRSHFSERRRGVWPAQRAESFFGPRADIGITRIRRRAYPRQDQEGGKVPLIEYVHVGIRCEVPAVS